MCMDLLHSKTIKIFNPKIFLLKALYLITTILFLRLMIFLIIDASKLLCKSILENTVKMNFLRN